MMNDKTYTPIGTQLSEVPTIGGVSVSRLLQELEEELLQRARAEYGDTVVWKSYTVDHGHTNRDGDHTPHTVTHKHLCYETPVYSHQDNLEMIADRVKEGFVRSLVKHHGLTEEAAREHLKVNGMFRKINK